MTEPRQQPRPVMRGTTGLDRNDGRRGLRKEIHHLLASHLLAKNRLFGGVHTMQLKDML